MNSVLFANICVSFAHVVISVKDLSKHFTIFKKDPGLKGTLRSLFTRKYEEKYALKNASVEIDEGEMVGLVGANGAGKTTFVKILSGIIHPSQGNASVLGFKPWERKNAFRKQIGLLMGQKAQLWWDLPAADCFLLLKEIYQIPHSEYSSTLDELIETLNVKSLITTQVRRLSLGERMKMELIASLLHKPKVLFLDEPTLGLDISSQKAIRNFLKSYVARHKPVVLLTSHYMQDIEELCKRIVIIREGSFIYDGDLSLIKDTYASHKVIRVVAEDRKKAHAHIEGMGFNEKVLQEKDGSLYVTVKKDKVPEVLSSILEKISVEDVGIEDEDIANIIEHIMMKGLQHEYKSQ